MTQLPNPDWSAILPQTPDEHFVHQQKLLNRRRRYEEKRDTLLGRMLDIGLCAAGSRMHSYQQALRWDLAHAVAVLKGIDRHSEALVKLKAWQLGMAAERRVA